MNADLLYQLALTLVPNIGDVHAKTLVYHFGDAASVFKARTAELECIEGIGRARAAAVKAFSDFAAAEKELRFIEQHHIQPLFLTDPAYPQCLLNCQDSPTLLFYKGQVDLNASKVVAIVGTRTHSEYGRSMTEKLVQDLSAHNILVVSGLAYGIDAIAHKAAIKNGLPTVGVVGHGLDKVYPADHTALAREMMQEKGGLLTEFFSATLPDKHHFPLRNRIVAGMSDATVVIETHIKGGSLITAKLADGYHRDVFAVPGRVNDPKSAGCNFLIQHNKAILLQLADDLLDAMGWNEKKKEKRKLQKELFIELSHEEKLLTQLLQEKEAVHIDELNLRSGLSNSAIAAAILNLELQSHSFATGQNV